MIVGLYDYTFEDLPLLNLGGGLTSAPVTGRAEIQFNTRTRGWKIVAIQIETTEDPSKLVLLSPDEGEGACGPFELVHDALLVDREESIEELVNHNIDTQNADGKAR